MIMIDGFPVTYCPPFEPLCVRAGRDKYIGQGGQCAGGLPGQTQRDTRAVGALTTKRRIWRQLPSVRPRISGTRYDAVPELFRFSAT